MDTERLEQLRDQTVNAIENLYEENDIIQSLPTTDYQSFFPIMKLIIEKLEQKKKEFEDFVILATTIEEKELYQEEINTIDFKLNICHKRLQEATSKKQKEEEAEITQHKHLIFATTESGNIYFEKDLSLIPYEFYDKIISCLERLENNEAETNQEKGKKLGSNHAKLNSIHEIKEFKIRIFYKYLTKDSVYVMLVRMKKDNWSKLDVEEPITRGKKTITEFEQLEKIMQDENKKREIIEKHSEIRNSIFQTLEENKRGVKNGK